METQSIQIKSEQTEVEQQQNESTIKEEVRDVEMEEEEETENVSEKPKTSDENDSDPVVTELDVFLSKSLANKIFVLQVRY